MTDATRYVVTKDIKRAVEGYEVDILKELRVQWDERRPHITCPYPDHADKNPSWRWDTAKSLAYCTCSKGDNIFAVIEKIEGIGFDAAKLRAAEILRRHDLIKTKKGGRGDKSSPEHCNSATPAAGCRLADYAEAKQLPQAFLQSLGLSEISYQGAPAIRIPYLAEDGSEVAVRFRIALGGKDKFRWRKGAKLCLYGCSRLRQAQSFGYVVLCEGESDTQTLWHAGIAAVGLPGAGAWRENRDAPVLTKFEKIFVIIEPDQGGKTVLNWLARSSIAPRVHLVRLKGWKDPSAAYVANPDGFRTMFKDALLAAEPYSEYLASKMAMDARTARDDCGSLPSAPDILARFTEDLERGGLVGETRNAKILYLAVTSRLFGRPVSVAVKGPSAGGKSHSVESVLKFFPPETYFERTAMSERALAYSDEDMCHRFLVLYEAAGMAGEMAAYLIRSLLSEGCIKYEVVEKTSDGMRPRLIERAGPTGLIVTTTEARLHPENETRLLSLSVKDTRHQTRAVLRQIARDPESNGSETIDYLPWQSFQRWLALGGRRVIVPFAPSLADAIPAVAVRLRRDFSTLLGLIRAHALLHRETRARDNKGRIIATIRDYAVVRELVADLFAEGLDATVPPAVRETVEAVTSILADGKTEATQGEVAAELELDKSAVSRRVRDATGRGYLVNNETKRGRPARIAIGDPMPSEVEVLPLPESLRADECCSDEVSSVGDDTPSPHVHQHAGWRAAI